MYEIEINRLTKDDVGSKNRIKERAEDTNFCADINSMSMLKLGSTCAVPTPLNCTSNATHVFSMKSILSFMSCEPWLCSWLCIKEDMAKRAKLRKCIPQSILYTLSRRIVWTACVDVFDKPSRVIVITCAITSSRLFDFFPSALRSIEEIFVSALSAIDGLLLAIWCRVLTAVDLMSRLLLLSISIIWSMSTCPHVDCSRNPEGILITIELSAQITFFTTR